MLFFSATIHVHILFFPWYRRIPETVYYFPPSYLFLLLVLGVGDATTVDRICWCVFACVRMLCVFLLRFFV